jgi:hypothetical protein
MENILYVITRKTGETANQATTDSVLDNIKDTTDKMMVCEFDNFDKKDLFYELLIKNITPENIGYVCIVPNNSMLDINYGKLIKEYIDDSKKKVYLPLVLLNDENIKGVLNSCIWKYNDEADYGTLGSQLALKQIDTTLYGALVPIELLLNKEFYNDSIQYYQQFHILNSIAVDGEKNDSHEIVGVPKILFILNEDLSFKDVPEAVKIENYKRAAEKWRNKEATFTITS